MIKICRSLLFGNTAKLLCQSYIGNAPELYPLTGFDFNQHSHGDINLFTGRRDAHVLTPVGGFPINYHSHFIIFGDHVLNSDVNIRKSSEKLWGVFFKLL